MTKPLRLSMVALVLVNLAFVAITEGARWSWLGPFFALTLLHPWLTRLTRLLVYRATWNILLLGAFALLVHHALNVGAQYLLEDGLMLAALCQVHLLNNLRSDQKPDLLFFNSFLIAVVTSFLSADVEYSFLFLVYAPVLVVGMQFLAVSKMGVRLSTRRVAWLGAGRAATAVAVTLVVFAVWPRDFHRRGLLGDKLRELGASRTENEIDFSENVDLDKTGAVTDSDRVVMRVRGPRDRVPSYWRGATQDGFDGRKWRPSRGVWYAGMDGWRMRRSNHWVRPGRAAPETIEVALVKTSARRLFLPLEARTVEIVNPPRHLRFQALPDLTFLYPRYQLPLKYRVRPAVRKRALGGRIPRSLPGRLLSYVSYRRSTVPGTVIRYAREIRKRYPKNVPQHQFVEAVRAFLSTRYPYLPPGADEGAGTLMEFMSGSAGGHCEYFATALVLMLRSQNVPCRLVTGYRSDDYNDVDNTLYVRAKHAHAWVEVLDPSGGWYTVDATPMIDEAAAASGLGFFKRMRLVAEGLWSRITSFDERRRAEFMVWLSSLPRKLLWPAVAVMLVGWGVVHLRRRRVPPAVRAFRRALKQNRATLRPGETPRMAARRVPALAEAAAAHERARYRP